MTLYVTLKIVFEKYTIMFESHMFDPDPTYPHIVQELIKSLYTGRRTKIPTLKKNMDVYIEKHPDEFAGERLGLVVRGVEIRLNPNDQETLTTAIIGVGRGGDAVLLQSLLEYWTTPDDSVLDWVADAGKLDCVAVLLDKCNPKFENSLALQSACLNDDRELFELLLPVSDPQAAMANLLAIDTIEKHIDKPLSENACFAHLQQHALHNTLTKATENFAVVNRPIRKL